MISHRKQSRIRALREDAGLTQLELSQAVKVTETTIANWEKGRSGLEWIERIILLCWKLDCKPDDLLEYVPQGESKDSNSGPVSFAELRKMIDTDQPPQVGQPIQQTVSEKMHDRQVLPAKP